MQAATYNANHDKLNIILEINPVCGRNAKEETSNFDYEDQEHLHERRRICVE